MEIKLGTSLRGLDVLLDVQELVTGRTLLCCVTGWGKSWTARRIVEELLGVAGIIIVDVEGEYYTLRDKFPKLWIMGRDYKMDPDAAPYVADQLIAEGASAVIDLNGPRVRMKEGLEFVGNFVDQFIDAERERRRPYLFVLEEADELIPENGMMRSPCRDQMLRLVKKGRKRGIGSLMLTQRPAWISKYAISQCVNKLVGRIEWQRDLFVLRQFARVPEALADPESNSAYALKNLERGCFFVSGKFVKRDDMVMVGPVETDHVSTTPQVFSGAASER